MRMSVSSRACDQRKEFQELHFSPEHDLMPIRPDSPLDDQPKVHDHERRLRRQVANSNERRRMQSINAGFQSLRNLIPHGDGEKMSKAAILQQTVGYIATLESEKTRLLTANQQLHQRLLRVHEGPEDLSPPLKRKKTDTESSDEGIAGMTIAGDLAMEEYSRPNSANAVIDMRKEMVALRKALDRERLQRLALQEQKIQLEEQVYPTNIRQAASEIQVERYEEEHQRRLEQQQQEEVREQRHVSCDEKRLRTLSEPPRTSPSRNMEILLEAFRVIEGDRTLFEDKTKAEPLSDDDMLSSGCESPLSRLSDSEVKQEPAAVPMMLGHPHPAAMAAAAMHLLPHPGLHGLVRSQQPMQQQQES